MAYRPQTNEWLIANRPNLPTEPCVFCSNPVVQYRKRRHPGELRFCSLACSAAANSLSQLVATWPPIRAGRCSRVGTKCMDCGKRIASGSRCIAHSRQRRLQLQRLCTRVRWLLPKQCAQCGDEFNRFDAGWHCNSCKKANKKANRRQEKVVRKARKRGACVYEFGIDHKSVYDNSDGSCALCRGRVADPSVWSDWDGKTWMPMAPTVDHIVPLAQGGTHVWSNVQLAHWRCNSLKSDRSPHGSQ